MKNVKFLDSEDVSIDEVSADFVALKIAGEKFMIDTDTLHDLTFRFAEMLAQMEAQEEASDWYKEGFRAPL